MWERMRSWMTRRRRSCNRRQNKYQRNSQPTTNQSKSLTNNLSQPTTNQSKSLSNNLSPSTTNQSKSLSNNLSLSTTNQSKSLNKNKSYSSHPKKWRIWPRSLRPISSWSIIIHRVSTARTSSKPPTSSWTNWSRRKTTTASRSKALESPSLSKTFFLCQTTRRSSSSRFWSMFRRTWRWGDLKQNEALTKTQDSSATTENSTPQTKSCVQVITWKSLSSR